MARGSNPTDGSSATSVEVFSPVDSQPGHASHLESKVNKGVTNKDLMLKLCANGSEISKLSQYVDELRAVLLSLQADNDRMVGNWIFVERRSE